MKEILKNKYYLLLGLVAVLSFVAGVIACHSVVLYGDSESLMSACHLAMASALVILIVFLCKGKF